MNQLGLQKQAAPPGGSGIEELLQSAGTMSGAMSGTAAPGGLGGGMSAGKSFGKSIGKGLSGLRAASGAADPPPKVPGTRTVPASAQGTGMAAGPGLIDKLHPDLRGTSKDGLTGRPRPALDEQGAALDPSTGKPWTVTNKQREPEMVDFHSGTFSPDGTVTDTTPGAPGPPDPVSVTPPGPPSPTTPMGGMDPATNPDHPANQPGQEFPEDDPRNPWHGDYKGPGAAGGAAGAGAAAGAAAGVAGAPGAPPSQVEQGGPDMRGTGTGGREGEPGEIPPEPEVGLTEQEGLDEAAGQPGEQPPVLDEQPPVPGEQPPAPGEDAGGGLPGEEPGGSQLPGEPGAEGAPGEIDRRTGQPFSGVQETYDMSTPEGQQEFSEMYDGDSTQTPDWNKLESTQIPPEMRAEMEADMAYNERRLGGLTEQDMQEPGNQEAAKKALKQKFMLEYAGTGVNPQQAIDDILKDGISHEELTGKILNDETALAKVTEKAAAEGHNPEEVERVLQQAQTPEGKAQAEAESPGIMESIIGFFTDMSPGMQLLLAAGAGMAIGGAMGMGGMGGIAAILGILGIGTAIASQFFGGGDDAAAAGADQGGALGGAFSGPADQGPGTDGDGGGAGPPGEAGPPGQGGQLPGQGGAAQGEHITVEGNPTQQEQLREGFRNEEGRVDPGDAGKTREQILAEKYGPDMRQGTADDPGGQEAPSDTYTQTLEENARRMEEGGRNAETPPPAPAPAPGEQPASAATPESMFEDNNIDANEAQQILNNPEMRSQILNMPPAQSIPMLESAAKNDPKIRKQIEKVQTYPRGMVMNVLTAAPPPAKAPYPGAPGMGMSPQDAQKFFRLAKQVRLS